VKRYPLQGHPILAGLLWAVLFVPLFLLITWMMGKPIGQLSGILILCALALPGGLIWGLTMNAFFARPEDRQ
jgi:hypothetical protein